MLNRINTRARIIIITSITVLMYLGFQSLNLNELWNISRSSLNLDLFKPVLIGLVAYWGTFWALFGRVSGIRFLTILLFPVLGIVTLSLMIEILVSNFLAGAGLVTVMVFSTAVLWLFSYVLLLTANILNAHFLDKIPLGQAGRASLFVLSLLIAYLVFFILFSNDLFIFIRLIAIFLVSAMLIYISLWTINLKQRQIVQVSMAVGLLITLISGILSIWPVLPPYLALVLSLFFYICLNIAMEIRDILSRWIGFEYAALFVICILLLVLFAQWGINGSMI